MAKELQEMTRSFRDYVKKITYYTDALNLLQWDLRTGAPDKGLSARADIIGSLSTEAFRLSVADEMGEYLDYFSAEENNQRLDEVMKALVQECRRDFDRFQQIPEAEYQKYMVLCSKAGSIWEKAKKQDDFDLFKPYLQQLLDFNIEFADLWGYEGNRYDALLDQYEPGMTVSKLDQVFFDLRRVLVPLLVRITSADRVPDDSIFKQYFSPEKQQRLSTELLEEIGYDFAAGRLDESEHPFTVKINQGDVRITTHFYPHDLKSALFSSLHEGGHALYEQNIDPELKGTPLFSGISNGIHESQSRFWENMVGRSLAFWERYYQNVKGIFPEEFKGVQLEDYYRGINRVEPSLIRVEADEMTYNLHIMVRYEIEKALINRQIAVDELPDIWKEKMNEYLGVEPADDRTGVLQDVHWSNGAFGYFPSYALGNIYAAQFLHTLHRELPDFEQLIRQGRLHEIKEWLIRQVYQHGKIYQPAEIMERVTGEKINAGYLLQYLEEKYTDIYQL